MRIAMWSGPRNLSTAMMYSFGNRPDCAVWDEPFYAAYLQKTGLDHPMRNEIIASGETDPKHVAQRCLGPIPDGKALFYQKHMTQHMLPEFDRSWIGGMTNIFLIRHPAKVIASYHAKRENPTLDDIGFRQQAEIFNQITQTQGTAPPVIDSDDILADPETMLRKLCAIIGLEFTTAMLDWPAGGHKDDGVWGDHWYASVRQSTGFAKPASTAEIPDVASEVLDAALGYYEELAKHRIRPD